MTRENEILRRMVKEIEMEAVNCLNTQPHDDHKCKIHIQKALSRIAGMTSEFAGLVEVKAYDIDWDCDLKGKNRPPKSTSVMMNHDYDISETIADALSDEFGWCVNGCKWKIV